MNVLINVIVFCPDAQLKRICLLLICLVIFHYVFIFRAL